MIRIGAQRALLRPLTHSRVAPAQFAQQFARFTSKPSFNQPSVLAKSLAVTAYRSNTALIRSYATAPTGVTQSAGHGGKQGVVSPQHEAHEEDVDMMAGMRHDIKVIQDTFALNNVPKEALNIGLAGVLPYLATSAATVYCAVEMNHAARHGTGWLLNEETAEGLLHVLEPLQVGYGAVILSCLGTVHWGLEWAGYGGSGGYRRYMIGVLAPAVAWPTILLPVEYALITQFLAFNLLYAIDSSATVRGWTPPWYSTYRFILTFVVGASIVVSLIGRGQIQDRIGKLPTATDRFAALQKHGSTNAQKKKAKDEEEDEEEEETDEEE